MRHVRIQLSSSENPLLYCQIIPTQLLNEGNGDGSLILLAMWGTHVHFSAITHAYMNGVAQLRQPCDLGQPLVYSLAGRLRRQ